MKKKIFFLMCTIFLIQVSLAAHYVVGIVEDSGKGETSNGKLITLWNPDIGISDNITDIIGPTGNSGTNNVYLIDCELLNNGCSIDDVLSLKIFNNGDNNVSETVNVTITGSGFDEANNITLNSPPEVNLTTPIQNQNISGETIFNCSIFDYDDNMVNISLWGNWTGTWQINETKLISPGENYKTFNKILPEGKYNWSCSVYDNLSIQSFADENRTLTVDNTPPVITEITLNESLMCSGYEVRVNCTTYEEVVNLDTVIIQSISPTNVTTNYTASILSGDTYFRDILISESGDWTFNCVSNDTLGNTNNLSSNFLKVDSNESEFFLNSSFIYINKSPEIEGENIQITANVSNFGCSDASNVNIGFYNGDKDSGGINLQNISNNILGRSSLNFSINYSVEIGGANIFVYVDINSSFSEDNESNNNGNKTIYLQSWQKMYGNTTINKILSNFLKENITFWQNHSNIQGNIFISDSESNINWYSLQALGRDTSNLTKSNDFSELDSLLSMNSLNDSIYNTFTNTGTPKSEGNYTIFQREINNIPIINSTQDNSNFITGILWDTSDDTNSEYDSIEKEDVVFVSNVNKGSLGGHGTYDYEARIPARLRQYDSTDTQEIFFYYEIN